MRPWQWWTGLALGCLLVLAGVAETVRAVRSGDGGLWFWFPTLVGGGTLLLSGTLLMRRHPGRGWALLCSGCVLGLLPTMWTVVVPILLLVLALTTLRVLAQDQEAEGEGADGPPA